MFLVLIKVIVFNYGVLIVISVRGVEVLFLRVFILFFKKLKGESYYLKVVVIFCFGFVEYVNLKCVEK